MLLVGGAVGAIRVGVFLAEGRPWGARGNEAEKAANVRLLECTSFGAFGRLYMAGTEAEIDSAGEAANAAIASITGVEAS